MTALDRVPCPCCGRCEAEPLPRWTEDHHGQDVGVWDAVCSCGAEWNGSEESITLRSLLRAATRLGVDPDGDDPSRIVRAVLHGLGLTDADILALADGARLRVERGAP